MLQPHKGGTTGKKDIPVFNWLKTNKQPIKEESKCHRFLQNIKSLWPGLNFLNSKLNLLGKFGIGNTDPTPVLSSVLPQNSF